jgi:YggT family protein
VALNHLPGGTVMLFLKAILNLCIVLVLLRLLVRPNEAFFHPIYRLIYRITDPLLLPARYLTRTQVQGILLTVMVLVVLRGMVYVTIGPWPLAGGVGRSLMDLFRLLFQAYMVILIIAVVSGKGYGAPLIHMMARAFIPIDGVLRRLGVPRNRYYLTAFFFLWILFAILISATASILVLNSVPSFFLFVQGLGEGLKLTLRLFPGFFTILIIIGALLSWVSPDPSNPIVQTIYSITEPLLSPFRRFIPNLGGLDISPIFAILAFYFIGRQGEQIVEGILRSLQTGSLT